MTEPDAATARAASDKRRLAVCAEIEQLISIASDEHPHLAIRELVPFLPEPARSRLVLLLAELPEIVPFPVEPTEDKTGDPNAEI